MRVHLGGHLSWYDPSKRSWLDVDLAGPLTLRALALQLGIPVGEIAFATVNRALASLDDVLVSGDDVVEFFSPMGGG